MTAQLTQDNFWDTNLSDIEAIFLPKGTKITDLKTHIDDTVPAQGSVLLNKVINTDNIIAKPTIFQKIQHFFTSK